MTMFSRATKSQARLRLGIIGPSGSGKTFSALAIARALSERIAVIDTEHGSASKYADIFEFDVLCLDYFDPRDYIRAIQAAQEERYGVVIIDSLSHAWIGQGGELEMVDRAAKRSKSNNSYTAWRDVTPIHNQLIDAIIRSDCHVIATMRSKVDYVLQPDVNGKLVPRKVGMAPIQREGMDYEFDVVGDLDLEHNLVIGKTRCREIDGQVITKPGEAFGRTLARWLSDGVPVLHSVPTVMLPEPIAEVSDLLCQSLPRGIDPNGHIDPEPTPADATREAIDTPPPSTPDQHRSIMDLVSRLGMTDSEFTNMITRRGVETLPEINSLDAFTIIQKLTAVAIRNGMLANEIVEDIQTATPNGPPIKMAAYTPNSEPADDHVISDVTRREKSEKPKGGRKSKQDKQDTATTAF